MPTHKSEDYKLSAVEYYLTEDKTQEEVCKIFKCSARSLLRWVDKYNENGEIKRHNRKPVAYKVHKDQVKFILDEIKKNKTITMQDLLEKLKEKYPIPYINIKSKIYVLLIHFLYNLPSFLCHI